jgi:hypothetical protein
MVSTRASPAPAKRLQPLDALVGFGRIVASEIEAPNLVANLVYKADKRQHNATMRASPARAASAAWSSARGRAAALSCTAALRTSSGIGAGAALGPTPSSSRSASRSRRTCPYASARAGNRRVWQLSVLRARTKAPSKIDAL